jgi:putative membrane protein
MRRGQAIGLRGEDIDLEGQCLFVVQQVTAVHGRAVVGTPRPNAVRASCPSMTSRSPYSASSGRCSRTENPLLVPALAVPKRLPIVRRQTAVMDTDSSLGDQEPDYRMSLALERTYLAYLRTGLALLAAGVAVAGALPDAGAPGLRRALGLALVLVGGMVLAVARPRWAAVDHAMRRSQPLPSSRVARSLGWMLVAAAVAAGVVVLLV